MKKKKRKNKQGKSSLGFVMNEAPVSIVWEKRDVMVGGLLLKSDFSSTMSNLLNAPSDIGPDTERPVGRFVWRVRFLKGFFIFRKAYQMTVLIG